MEKTNYEDVLEMVLTEITERGIQCQREDNPEIESLLQEKTALSVQAKKCLSELDSEVKATLIKYYELSETIADRQIKYLYLQGAQDCVYLLKKLGVI